MDKVTQYKQLIKQALTHYADLFKSSPSSELEIIGEAGKTPYASDRG